MFPNSTPARPIVKGVIFPIDGGDDLDAATLVAVRKNISACARPSEHRRGEYRCGGKKGDFRFRIHL
jgi:hypothetical protein